MSKRGTRKATMRAWAINAYGGPERMQIMELPVPEPGPDDVLIRMAGAEVGDWDILVRDGSWPMGRPFPLVLGLAGSGTVAALGDKVTEFGEDDPVYAYSYPLYDNGAWAEYMLVPTSYAARAPSSLDLTRAGGVPIVGLTAHETLTDILEVHRGDVVLITAAAGGVGHLAVQIASRLGGRVIATASRRNEAFVRGLGAEAVIDYQSEDLLEAIRSRYPRASTRRSTASRARRPTRSCRPCGTAGRWSTSPARRPPSGPMSASSRITSSGPMATGLRASPA